jgi:hypothetical protein
LCLGLPSALFCESIRVVAVGLVASIGVLTVHENQATFQPGEISVKIMMAEIGKQHFNGDTDV